MKSPETLSRACSIPISIANDIWDEVAAAEAAAAEGYVRPAKAEPALKKYRSELTLSARPVSAIPYVMVVVLLTTLL
ncbi:hypothetical protein COCOBI_10-0120 [Coccomyxa sp. Obi]|nr:hypothetical protein COCOBI_10-0120 [Coccomyxa sp. Obi]